MIYGTVSGASCDIPRDEHDWRKSMLYLDRTSKDYMRTGSRSGSHENQYKAFAVDESQQENLLCTISPVTVHGWEGGRVEKCIIHNCVGETLRTPTRTISY